MAFSFFFSTGIGLDLLVSSSPFSHWGAFLFLPLQRTRSAHGTYEHAYKIHYTFFRDLLSSPLTSIRDETFSLSSLVYPSSTFTIHAVFTVLFSCMYWDTNTYQQTEIGCSTYIYDTRIVRLLYFNIPRASCSLQILDFVECLEGTFWARLVFLGDRRGYSSQPIGVPG